MHGIDFVVDPRATPVAKEMRTHDAVPPLLARLDLVPQRLQTGANLGEYAIGLKSLDGERVDGWLSGLKQLDERVYPWRRYLPWG